MTSVGMLRKGHPRRLSGILAGELQPVIMGCETGVVSRPYDAMAWIAGAGRNRLCWVEGEFPPHGRPSSVKRLQFRSNSETGIQIPFNSSSCPILGSFGS
jgi:hypothetical protein